jgi:putative cell wall-binding protein
MAQHRKKSTAAGDRRLSKAKSTQKRARETTARSARKRWSQNVTETSDALDLREGVFKLTDPKKIAASLKRSAEHSSRRKANPYRSALSMLTFYINRAGSNLSTTQRSRLEKAKAELKKQFGVRR